MDDNLPAAQGAEACCDVAQAAHPGAAQGSRRRRLWEFDSHVFCPVVGVCLPIASLRRLVDKVMGGQALADDYEMHCGTVNECKRRTPLAEAVHRELDRRYVLALRHASAAKSTDALAAWWRLASSGPDLPGAFWATLTHARCTPALEHQVLGEVHMLQHQVGAAQRVDLAQLDLLGQENTALKRELAALQQRQQQLAAEQSREMERLQSELVRQRAQGVGHASTISLLRDELAVLERAAPGLRSRLDLHDQSQAQAGRIAALESTVRKLQNELERQRQRAVATATPTCGCAAQTEALGQMPALRSPVLVAEEGASPALGDRSVLCVGGRPASVPLYRHIVERTGGRFLHHDGGEEQSVSRLDATLAAADLVICQTGCISHDAYWRVKDHCKRTGKPCVFVENPGSASLRRALAQLRPQPQQHI